MVNNAVDDRQRCAVVYGRPGRAEGFSRIHLDGHCNRRESRSDLVLLILILLLIFPDNAEVRGDGKIKIKITEQEREVRKLL